MRLSRELDGKPIISIADGRILGKTKDVYLDPELNFVAGFYVGTEGLIKRKNLVIKREDVVLLGIDAILVKNADVVTDDRELPEAKLWVRQDTLDGRQVDTAGGTKLGIAGDVVVDQTGNIIEIALSRVMVEGPLAEKRNIPRAAVVDVGKEDGHMLVDMGKLESIMSGAEQEPVDFVEPGEDVAETAVSEDEPESDETLPEEDIVIIDAADEIGDQDADAADDESESA